MEHDELSPSARARAEYLELYLEKKDLEEKLETVSKLCTEAGERLVKDFEKEGMQSIKVTAPDGTNRTLFLKRTLWAKLNTGFETVDGVEALKAAGLGEEYVKESYNSQSVSSFFRDREKNGEDPVPPELRGIFQTTEIYGVGVRKS